MNNKLAWSILIAVVLAGALGLYVWFARETATPQTSQPATAAKPEEPAIRHPIGEARLAEGQASEPTRPLPSLADSDKPMRDALTKWFGQNLEKYFNLQDIIHRVVATVDNLPLGDAPVQLMPVKPVPGWLVTTGKDEKLTLSPKNAARYRPYVQLAESAPVAPLVAVYVNYYPLFQEQYEKLGYPGKYFNDRLVEVIDHLLATPEVKDPVLLTQTSVLYQFADPNLERLSAGQKILVRMGGANATLLKEKLKDIRRALVARPRKE